VAFPNYIPVRRNLVRDPLVRRIARASGIPPAHAVGCLVVLWAIADEYGEDRDGHADVEWSLTELDAECGIEGFCDAMVAAGWLAETATGVRFVGYAAKAGGVEKRRMAAARRQAMWRQRRGREDSEDDDGPDGAPSPTAEAVGHPSSPTPGSLSRRAGAPGMGCPSMGHPPVRNGGGVTQTPERSRSDRDKCSAGSHAACSAPRNTRRVTPHHTTPPTPPTPRAPPAHHDGDGVSQGNGQKWLTRIRMEDLTDTTRLLALYDRAIGVGLIPESVDGLLRFTTLAERALRVTRRAGNPPALFASLVCRPGQERYVTDRDEQRAVARLRMHGLTIEERAAERERHQLPMREADRDEVRGRC
jgi:hypothetical protein